MGKAGQQCRLSLVLTCAPFLLFGAQTQQDGEGQDAGQDLWGSSQPSDWREENKTKTSFLFMWLVLEKHFPTVMAFCSFRYSLHNV